jgi:hypothetical protein
VELRRDWLNAQREKALEMSGDPEAAAPFVWAETRALAGEFFLEASVSDFADAPEMQESGGELDDSMTLGEAAEVVIDRVLSSAVVPA